MCAEPGNTLTCVVDAGLSSVELSSPLPFSFRCSHQLFKVSSPSFSPSVPSSFACLPLALRQLLPTGCRRTSCNLQTGDFALGPDETFAC